MKAKKYYKMKRRLSLEEEDRITKRFKEITLENEKNKSLLYEVQLENRRLAIKNKEMMYNLQVAEKTMLLREPKLKCKACTH